MVTVRLMYGPKSGTDVQVEAGQTEYYVDWTPNGRWDHDVVSPLAEDLRKTIVYRPKLPGSKQWYPVDPAHYYLGDIWDGYRPGERKQDQSSRLARGSKGSESERGQSEL